MSDNKHTSDVVLPVPYGKGDLVRSRHANEAHMTFRVLQVKGRRVQLSGHGLFVWSEATAYVLVARARGDALSTR